MKKILGILILILICAMSVGCSQTEETIGEEKKTTSEQETNNEQEDQLVIGFTALTFNNPFYVQMLEEIKAYAKDNNITIMEFDGQMDPAKQMTGLENMLSAKVDGILLNPVDSQAVIPAVKKANELGIPIVTVDNNVEEGEIVSFVASDNYMAGKIIGEYIVERLNGEGKLCVIDYPLLEGPVQRVAGLTDVLNQYEGIEIIGQQKGGVVTDAMKLAETWLQQHEEIDCIFGINDPNALGALTAIETAGRDKETFVVGIDGAQEAIDAMKDGRNFGATAAQQPREMGKMALETLVKHINGEKVDAEIKIPVYLITKDTIDDNN